VPVNDPDEDGIVWTTIPSSWGDKTPPLALLGQFYHRLTEIYATYLETRSALSAWRRQLEANLPKDALNRDLNHVWFGRHAGENPVQHKRKTVDLIARLAEDGATADTLREGAVVLAYAAWEDDARVKLADTLSLKREDLKNDTFGDLRRYRHAIAHNGKIDTHPKVLPFIRKGERMKLTDEQFYELFRLLIDAVNEVGETYCGFRSAYSLDKEEWLPSSRPRGPNASQP
jgi:hypothetical protein